MVCSKKINSWGTTHCLCNKSAQARSRSSSRSRSRSSQSESSEPALSRQSSRVSDNAGNPQLNALSDAKKIGERAARRRSSFSSERSAASSLLAGSDNSSSSSINQGFIDKYYGSTGIDNYPLGPLDQQAIDYWQSDEANDAGASSGAGGGGETSSGQSVTSNSQLDAIRDAKKIGERAERRRGSISSERSAGSDSTRPEITQHQELTESGGGGETSSGASDAGSTSGLVIQLIEAQIDKQRVKHLLI